MIIFRKRRILNLNSKFKNTKTFILNKRILHFFSDKDNKNFNYYEELELKKSATKSEIKTKYKELVKKYHPDVYKGSDTKRFQRIQEAYSTLVSPRKRATYDEELLRKERPNDFSSAASNVDWDDIDEEYKENKTAREFYKDFSTVGNNPEDKSKIKEEYEKFKNEKIYTKFEDIDVRENQLLRNMNEADRKKQEFIAKKNLSDAEKIIRFKEEEQSFEDIVDDTINLMNENTTRKRAARADLLGKRNAIMSGVMRIIAVLAVGGIFASFAFMAEVKLDAEERAAKLDLVKKESYLMYLREDLKSRMVFDHSED